MFVMRRTVRVIVMFTVYQHLRVGYQLAKLNKMLVKSCFFPSLLLSLTMSSNIHINMNIYPNPHWGMNYAFKNLFST
jgi:hypothetical protein